MIVTRAPAFSWLLACAPLIFGCLTEIPLGDLPDAGEPLIPEAGAGGTSTSNGGTGGTVNNGYGGDANVPQGGGGGGGNADAGTAGSSPQGPPGCDESSGTCLAPLAAPLPQPMAGVPYATKLAASGGTPPYQWEIISPPASDFELEIRDVGTLDEATYLVSSDPRGPRSGATLTLRVKDNSEPPQSKQLEVNLTLRASNWLAYTALDSPSLSLVLPQALEIGTPVDVKALAPSAQIVEPRVVDFRFSPSGAHVAVRFRDATDVQHLAVFEAPYWERVIELPAAGSVTTYEWSADASTLAVAAVDAAVTSIGGVRFGSAGAQPTLLASGVMPIDAASEIVWVGNDRIVFYANDEFAYPIPRFARVTSTAIEEFFDEAMQTPHTLVRLLGSERGVFLPTPDLFGLEFMTPTAEGWAQTVHIGENLVVSPKRDRVASAEGGQLVVYEAAGIDGESPPLSGSAECEKLLTWSQPGHRILCARSGLEGGSILSLVSLDETGLGQSLDFLGLDEETTVLATQRHSFSPDGNWFSVASLRERSSDIVRHISTFRVTSEGVQQPFTELVLEGVAQSNVDLIWSPSSEWLLMQVGNDLLFQPLIAGMPLNNLLGTQVGDTGPCVEAFIDPAWCGSGKGREIRWSFDSSIAAARTTTGAIELIRLGNTPETHMLPNVCAATCVFEFQPNPNR